ncbi:MAG: YHS domain-containing protein [Actinomycetota bacterium]|nr:YHS domain-containing protein [Actinomycetota bacterium]
MFADLAGYTALTEAHGDEQAADIAAEFFARVRELLDDYDAHEVKAIGDALLLRVPVTEQALHLAARLMGDLGARHRGLGIRVGMHTGPAVRRGEDWFGGTVNVAARVADLAAAGEVLMTAATRALVGPAAMPGQLRPMGQRELKNVRDPVELFLLVPEGTGAERELPVDPVCRMSIDPAQRGGSVIHRGTLHHFCSAACSETFREAPHRYPAQGSA